MSTQPQAEAIDRNDPGATPDLESYSSIAILAGNSRLQMREDGSILVEPQLKAFEAALKHSQRVKAVQGVTPKISIAFDHRGVFRLQFLAEGLTNSQKRNPRLAHLNAAVIEVFADTADRFDVPISEICVIQEDSARQHAMHVLSTESHPEAILRRMIAQGASDEMPRESGCTGKLTCAVITKEYFQKAACSGAGASHLLEVFFEDSPWSRDLAYVRGLQLSHLLGVETAIRLNLVGPEGNVTRGQVTVGTGAASNV